MANIIYDARKIKLMEAVKELSDLIGNNDDWFNSFWSSVMENTGIYEELLYYIDHHDLLCRYTIDGYSIADLFVWQMSNYDLLHDTGKNDASCCKEAMVLFAFEAMAEMAKDPETYKNRISPELSRYVQPTAAIAIYSFVLLFSLTAGFSYCTSTPIEILSI